MLDDDERHQGDDADDRGRRRRLSPPCSMAAYEMPARAIVIERRAGQVERGANRRPRLGHVPDSDQDRGRRQRDVDQEHQPPAHGVDQPAAEERPDRTGDARQTGPGADRLAPVVGMEGGGDDRQAAGHEQRSADALDRPRRDQQPGGRRHPAQHRGAGEHDGTGDEHRAMPIAVAEAAAEQQQRRERDEIGVDDPLQAGDRRAEVVADRRQGDVDHCSVEERHARPEHGRRHDPSCRRRPEANARSVLAGHGRSASLLESGAPRDRKLSARRCRPVAGQSSTGSAAGGRATRPTRRFGASRQ